MTQPDPCGASSATADEAPAEDPVTASNVDHLLWRQGKCVTCGHHHSEAG